MSNNFIIVGMEDQKLTRAIKESIYIRVNDPSFNRIIGKYHLPNIKDDFFNTPELNMKHPCNHSGHSICHNIGI